jgi:hypothetical protein
MRLALPALAARTGHGSEQLVLREPNRIGRPLLVDQLLVGGLLPRLQKPSVVIGDDLMSIPLAPVPRPKLR